MNNETLNAVPEERKHTDKSLRQERATSDKSLEENLNQVAEESQETVQHARNDADTAVSKARENADQFVEVADTKAAQAKIDASRRREDEALQAERATADEVMRSQRAEYLKKLKSLLPFERSKTDSLLLTEREHADHAIATRDDFLGIVCHDLRTLLGTIVMSADTIIRRVPDDPNGREIKSGTERIQRSAARMNRLLSDLIDVASIEAGKLEIERAENDAFYLIQEATEMFKPMALEQGIQLQMKAPRPLRASFDYDRLLQVLANVITNAIKFTPAGGTIQIIGERVENTLWIKVSDTGSGIPPHLLEAVFERFWQRNSKDSRGIGLGLYISRCLIHAHGGTIHAESKPGKGTTFVIMIPLTN